MRPATLTTLVFVALGYAASAQFTIQPQLGFENSRTSIQFNDLSSFSPLQGQFSIQPGVRMDYKFKKTIGPFLGITTNRSQVSYNFSDPATGMSMYRAAPGKMQLQIESGLQYSTKALYFNKPGSSNSSSKSKSSSKAVQQKTQTKKSCGDYYASRSHCGSKSTAKAQPQKAKDKGWWMKIQPSAGFAFVPSRKEDLVLGNGFEYKAGNWNSGFIAGSGFEFGKNSQRKFTLSVNYLKGIGNLNQQSIVTTKDGKSTTTTFDSEASGWNLKMGIPISTAKKPVVKKTEQKAKTQQKTQKKECGQYKIQYKCRKQI